MSRRVNFVNYILSILLTTALVFIAVYVCSSRYLIQLKDVVLYFIIGFILACFLGALFHELGHVIFGKLNKFKIVSMQFWFIKFARKKGKMKCGFSKITDSAGSTLMVTENYEKIEKRFSSMTFGGLLFSFVFMLIGVIPIAIVSLPLWAYGILCMFLPTGAYYFFGNALPITDQGIKNDGAMIVGLKKGDFASKVIISLLKIQSELYHGKSPSEIEESFYFDLPQLPEDDLNFTLLLKARYSYYLDKGDFENSNKVVSRMLSLEEYIPKEMFKVIKADALYNYCLLMKDEDKADDLMYEIENFLNKVNTATNIRVKLAYMLLILNEKENAELFYKKGIKEAKKSEFSGLAKYELKQFEKLKENF